MSEALSSLTKSVSGIGFIKVFSKKGAKNIMHLHTIFFLSIKGRTNNEVDNFEVNNDPDA